MPNFTQNEFNSQSLELVRRLEGKTLKISRFQVSTLDEQHLVDHYIRFDGDDISLILVFTDEVFLLKVNIGSYRCPNKRAIILENGRNIMTIYIQEEG